MKFKDLLRLSFANLFNGKLRSVLFAVVMLILTTSLIILTSIGVNLLKVIDESIKYNNTEVDLEYLYSSEEEFSEEELQDITSNTTKSLPFLTNYFLNVSNNGDIMAIQTDQNYFVGVKDFLVDGRMWNETDKGKPHIWLRSNYAKLMQIQVGDQFKLVIDKNSFEDDIVEYLTVVGIVNCDTITNLGYDLKIVDKDYLEQFDVKYHSIKFRYPIKQNEEEFKISTFLKMQGLINKYNTYEEEVNPDGLKVNSYCVNDKMRVIYFALCIFAVVFLLSTIIIALSMSCIANSMNISIEKNRKFFGTMKAIGMKNSTMRNVVRLQVLFLIILSVVLATAITFGVLAGVKPYMMVILLNFDVISEFSILVPHYIPIITCLYLVLFVFLFTIKTLKKMSKMDVVSVINEVW